MKKTKSNKDTPAKLALQSFFENLDAATLASLQTEDVTNAFTDAKDGLLAATLIMKSLSGNPMVSPVVDFVSGFALGQQYGKTAAATPSVNIEDLATFLENVPKPSIRQAGNDVISAILTADNGTFVERLKSTKKLNIGPVALFASGVTVGQQFEAQRKGTGAASAY